jgi:dihydrofolate reductase
MMSTGAVVAGRGTFEPADGCGGDHHDGVTSAMTQAKEAAGDKNVLVHGAGTAQLALVAGVLDEIELHVIPVLFGQGRRLFEGLAPEQIELERTRILEGENGVTHVHYRVQR